MNIDLYKLACLYMGSVELYDRSLTDMCSPSDITEAFIDIPFYRSISNSYANSLRHNIEQLYGVPFNILNKIIKQYSYYTAQNWVDEYYRLWDREKDEYIRRNEDDGSRIKLPYKNI